MREHNRFKLLVLFLWWTQTNPTHQKLKKSRPSPTQPNPWVNATRVQLRGGAAVRVAPAACDSPARAHRGRLRRALATDPRAPAGGVLRPRAYRQRALHDAQRRLELPRVRQLVRQSHHLQLHAVYYELEVNGKRSIAVRKTPRRYGNSHAILDLIVLPATRQTRHSRPYSAWIALDFKTRVHYCHGYPGTRSPLSVFAQR